LIRHGDNPDKKRIATFLLRNKWVAAVRGFADRGPTPKTRQTRRSPTHNRHETNATKSGRIMPDGSSVSIQRAAKPITICVSGEANIGVHFRAHNRAVGRFGERFGKADSQCLRAFAAFRTVRRVLGNRGQGLGPLRCPTRASPFATRGNFLQGFRKSKIKGASDWGRRLRRLPCGFGCGKRQSSD